MNLLLPPFFRRTLPYFRHTLLYFALLVPFLSFSQPTTLSTYPATTTDSRGPGTSFELTVTQHFHLNNLEIPLGMWASNFLFDIYIRPGGVQHSAGFAPVVSTTNGWVLVGRRSISFGTTGIPVLMNEPLDTILTPGTYGVYIAPADFSFGAGARVWAAGMTSSFTDGIATINSGPNIGYRGIPPVTWVNDTILFVGSVVYTPFVPLTNDATVFSVDSPTSACPGSHLIKATIGNLGNNIINNVTVNWSVDGVTQTPVAYSQPIDTIGAANTYQAEVSLGNFTFVEGESYDVKVWTTSPNGNADPNTANDTVTKTIETSISGGLFTIDPLGSGTNNFLNVQDAVDFIAAKGICGPVTFNIAAGVHTGQIIIPEIFGSSATNTITFQPDPQNTAPVELSYSSTSGGDNFVVLFDGCDYVTMNELTVTNLGAFYSTILRYANDAQHITISNSRIIALQPSSTSRNYALISSDGSGDNSYLVLRDNYIYGGSYGIIVAGRGATRIVGVEITGNEIIDPYQYGMTFTSLEGMEVRNNRVFSNTPRTSSSYGMRFFNCGKGLQITGNEIAGSTNFPRYGILCDFSLNTTNEKGLIANNRVYAGSTTSTSSSVAGIDADDGEHLDVVHNTVVVEGSSTRSAAAKLTDGSNNQAFNNSFLHHGNGYSIDADGSFTLDYNNLAASGSTLGQFNGTSVADLVAWQALGPGANSISELNIYSKFDSLRTCDARIDGKGTWLSYLTEDIDEEVRNTTTPDIGADEFDIAPAVISIGDTLEFCSGADPLELSELTGNVKFGNYVWSTSETTNSIEVTTGGTYWLDITVCGTSTDTVEVVDISIAVDFDFDTEVNDFEVDFTDISTNGESYLWDFGDGNTSMDPNPTHTYDETGTYTVSLTVMNDCDTVTLEKDVTITSYIGIGESSLDELLTIFPNPTKGSFNLSVNGKLDTENTQLSLLNITGQVVAEYTVNLGNGDTKTFDVSQLEKGIYMVQIKVANEAVMRRLIIQ